ncbi:MAG: DUF72 domain-containing protein [Armatimonadota bacterium]|nr:DUF72 domain-containing protein [bacterium]
MGEIRLGTSGYSFGNWKGIVYPGNIKDSEMLSYYISHYRLNSVEINYTYYRMPSTKVFDSYARKSPNNFIFTVKLFTGITHNPWIGGSPVTVNRKLCSQFLAGIRPLTESGKLGCLLAQFPPHMRCGRQAWDYLLSLHEAFNGYPLVYEFRNKTWVSEHTIAALKQAGIGYCAVDEPPVGPLMPLVPAVTSDIAYLRLHGRNKQWFRDASVRYDYLYSENELKALLPVVNSMAARSSTVYIQFNNCHAGSALRNVKMMQYLLGIDMPPIQGVLF